jgi:ribosomal protein S6
MSKSQEDIREGVYEVGYLIVPSVPVEKIPTEAEAVKTLITKTGAKILAEEAPKEEHLAYTIRKKTVSGSYDKYDIAYFGWFKFEVGSDKVEVLKKEIEIHPIVLRMLMISTVKEDTYLGKHASALAEEFSPSMKRPVEKATVAPRIDPIKNENAAPATIEEMDKSIDAMVKEA